MAQVTRTILCSRSALITKRSPSTSFPNPSNPVTLEVQKDIYDSILWLGFENQPDIAYKRLYSAELTFEAKSESGIPAVIAVIANASINFSSATWNNKPGIANIGITRSPTSSFYSYTLPRWSSTSTASLKSQAASYALRYGFGIRAYLRNTATGYESSLIKVPSSYPDSPTLTITYDDSAEVTSQIKIKSAPTSGYVNPRTATPISWELASSDGYYSISQLTQSEVSLFWRAGTSGSYTKISIPASSTSYTIPANTFPTGQTVQWYLYVRDNRLNESTTQTYTVSTAAELVTTTPISPANSVEANDGTIAFSWERSSADGFQPGTTQINWSEDGSTWHFLASVNGNQYDAPANTFPSGTIYWRALTYNIDEVPGPLSDTVSFISFGAPAAPSVTVVSGNFAVIRWQATDQSAYRVTVAGKTYGPVFGAEKSMQLTDPLSAGDYTAEVEVQNSFGLWSQKGTASFTVTQAAYSPPHITASKFGVDATISYRISNVSRTNEVFIYRDGVKIASMPVEETGTFVDRHVLGQHSYQVIARINNYYAVYSPEQISGTLKVCGAPRIAPFSGGEWLKLRLSETTRRTEVFTKQRQISLRHFTGAEYPVAEVSPFSDMSGSYDCAFENVDDANAFEALYGQVVILKTKAENVVIGVLSGYEKRVSRHYIAYTFTLQRIYWRDYLDLTND